MTVKITKRGTLPEEVVFRFKCNNCKTEFEANRTDGVYSNNQHDGETLGVDCPICNKICYGSPTDQTTRNQGWRDRVVEGTGPFLR